MQFFIIHPDPKTNARLLPDYAIKSVNVREGFQILSDIGHNLGVTWKGQYKPYSIWHAETRRFMVNREAFKYFIKHYNLCVAQYSKRFGKDHACCKLFYYFIGTDAFNKVMEALPENRTHEESMLDYMIRAKKDKMWKFDYNNLLNYKENINVI